MKRPKKPNPNKKRLKHVSFGFDEDGYSLLGALIELGGDLDRVATRAMTDAGELVRRRSISNSPVDTGDLEECHTLTVSKEADSIVAEIWIDDSKQQHMKEHSMDTSEYALLMHECLKPYGPGPYGLGEKSQKKAAAGHKVGGKFLERAVNDSKEEIDAMIEEIFSDAIERLR